MDFCDNYNDRALTFQVQNFSRPRPMSQFGRNLDSNCVNPTGLKNMQRAQEVHIIGDRYNDAIYYSARMERPPTLQTMVGRKYLQFITDEEDY